MQDKPHIQQLTLPDSVHAVCSSFPHLSASGPAPLPCGTAPQLWKLCLPATGWHADEPPVSTPNMG